MSSDGPDRSSPPVPHVSSPAPLAPPALPAQRPTRRSSWKLYLLLAVCTAPVVASYLMYYVFPPSERTNYGDLVDPQRPVPTIAAAVVHASPGAAAPGKSLAALHDRGLAALTGQWILLAIDQGACAVPCAEKLFFMRQIHVSLGKERDRLERVLLVTDASALPAGVLAAHPDMTVLRVDPLDLAGVFPVEADTGFADHIYLIDPLHNLMMRFPKGPDPARTRKDLKQLMRASRIG